MGGQDLYYSKRNSDGSWGVPVNLGYPINTGSEEEHLVVNAEGDKAYFSSGRPGGKGGKDIYMFELPESLRPRPVTYLSGTITDRVSGKPISASINIIDLSDGKTKAISISDKVSGQYMVCLPSGGSYALNVSSAGYLFYSGNYNLEHRLKPDGQFRADISLSPVQAGSSMILRNIFFKSGSWELLAESETELRELNDFLMLNKDLRIEIGGHTDNQGNDQDNLNLSLKRAEAVVNYLKSKGVEGVRLQAKGYGETKPVSDNSTEEGRQKNRRTEFLILEK
jgi:outer membrane protein OmpA-like peptidoglycan-associated protein